MVNHHFAKDLQPTKSHFQNKNSDFLSYLPRTIALGISVALWLHDLKCLNFFLLFSFLLLFLNNFPICEGGVNRRLFRKRFNHHVRF